MNDRIDETPRFGSCYCRAVSFRVIGQPLRVGICHCADCRKTSGSAFSAYAVWPVSAYEQTGQVGTYGNRSFCVTCGSRVTWVHDGEAEVMIGSLDVVPTDLAPEYELWVGRRENWLHPLPQARQFDHDRDTATEPTPLEPGQPDRPRNVEIPPA
ncbi:GFA family protein [Aminobacter sp. DSM 101952]|uniref:GFA family protein n=1 Tax=Aminobacter sp. DSM 101952 TaxID=2735891 RepID=UPI0009EB000E|nr:GFA family protein [Aminobacter sp. DSM 101952]